MLLDAHDRHGRGSKRCATAWEFAVSYAGEGSAMASMVQFNFEKPAPAVIRLVERRRASLVTIEQGDEDALGRMAERYGFLAAQMTLGRPYLGRPMSREETLFIERLAAGVERSHAEFAARAALEAPVPLPAPAELPVAVAEKKPVQSVTVLQQPNVAVGEVPIYKEREYSITEIMAIWGKSRGYVTARVKFEPGVARRPGPTGKRFTYGVPESVLQRLYTRSSN
jgi:hypothetical protein